MAVQMGKDVDMSLRVAAEMYKDVPWIEDREVRRELRRREKERILNAIDADPEDEETDTTDQKAPATAIIIETHAPPARQKKKKKTCHPHGPCENCGREMKCLVWGLCCTCLKASQPYKRGSNMYFAALKNVKEEIAAGRCDPRSRGEKNRKRPYVEPELENIVITEWDCMDLSKVTNGDVSRPVCIQTMDEDDICIVIPAGDNELFKQIEAHARQQRRDPVQQLLYFAEAGIRAMAQGMNP
jgi:hypothetical protein